MNGRPAAERVFVGDVHGSGPESLGSGCKVRLHESCLVCTYALEPDGPVRSSPLRKNDERL